MKKIITSLFSIYPGEEKSALLFALLGFLWAFTISSAVKYADALFIVHIGSESLPTVYILTGGATIALAAFLLSAFQRIETYKIFQTVLSLALIFYTFVAVCLYIGIQSPSFFFTLRIVGYLILNVILTCYWTFVDHYHHIQDAKRCYSLFTSSIFLGIATTGITMRLGIFSFQSINLSIVVLLGLTIVWIEFIRRSLTPVHNEHEHESYTSQEELSFPSLFRSILSSPFTLFLFTGSFIIYMLFNFSEFNYMSSYEAHFSGQPFENLTQFLGQVVTGISIASIFIGLFLYPRIIRRFGVTSMLLFTPGILLLAFFGWNLTDWLIFPVLGNFLDEGAVYVIEDSNLNLMLNGVPSKVKYKIRLFVESFFEPFGSVVSGLLLSLPLIHSKALGLVLSLIACLVMVALRRRYLGAIYKNLEENAVHFERPLKYWFRKLKDPAQHRLLAILRLGHKPDFAIEGLMQFNDYEMLGQLLKLLDQLDAGSKLTFLEHLPKSPFAAHPEVLEYLESWAVEEGSVRGAILLYLAKQGRLDPDQANLYLESVDLNLRGAGIISLKKAYIFHPPETASHFRNLAANEIKKMLDSKNKEEICMALTLLGFEGTHRDLMILLQYLKHPFIPIARAAAASIAEIVDHQASPYAKVILTQLKVTHDSSLRLLCLEALEKIQDDSILKDILDASIHFKPSERRSVEKLIQSFGKRTIPVLLGITQDVGRDNRIRVLSGRALGRVALPMLRTHLYDIIATETERAFFYFYHMHQIHDHKLITLKESLLSSYHSVLDFIIQLLGVAGELEDCELLSRLIRSEHPKVRAQVIEALEKTCDITLFRLIDPLINELPIQIKLQHYVKSGYPACTLNELLDKLSHSPLELDQVVAATFMHRLQVPQWKESLMRQLQKNENIFHHFASELLENEAVNPY